VKNILIMKQKLTIEEKIKNLEALKSKLDSEIESLQEMRHEKVLEVLRYLPHSVSLDTIIGGMIHLVKEIEANPKQAEDWSSAGKKFLGSKKSDKRSTIISLLRKKD